MKFYYKGVFLVFLLLLNFFAESQQINQKLINNNNNEEILIGLCNRKAFKSGQYAEWFNDGYSYYDYLIERKNLDSIKNQLDSISIMVVMGTWCSDSKEQFPRLMAILDYLKFSENKMTIYCVDRNKKTLMENIDKLNILLVPTFIFIRKGKEIGRIVEKPKESIEKDMVKIIRTKA
jgi:hypothetical protein